MNDVFEEFSKEWRASGFFYEARKLHYDENAARRVIDTLRSIDIDQIPEGQKLRLISVIWELPYIALYYRDRCVVNGVDAESYMKAVVEIEKVVSVKMREVLGLPLAL